MITITVDTEKQYPISKRRIQKDLSSLFKKHGIVSEAEASVLIVSAEKMLEYVKMYLKETGEEAKSHPVLSFPQTEIEGPFQFPPDNILHLGEIIVSYDHAKQDAENRKKTPESCVIELAEHGALHLMGIHHD